ncbi:MAG: GNAT family N-acetyltransferase [Betaproteobacteria bacterium]|nr:MAG: GNAT family N-acetyltransferase [Betaproteobacteria bacterium]
MVTPSVIRPCAPAELPALVALLDQEFIFSKDRRISLARRLPGVVHADNCANILLACHGETIAACVVIKRFDWIAPERSWRAAMIGLVWTNAAERGLGLATQLLRAAQARLHADGAAFAVLFTAQPAFYRRLGWISADCGLYGSYAGAGGDAARCTPVDANAIEAMRSRQSGAYLRRDRASYDALPLPSERLEMRSSIGSAAYSIYGVQADRAYVYELGGEASGRAALWQDICAAAATVHINERRGSASAQWLSTIPGTIWRDQALAMWLPLAEPDCARHFGDWYVPYLDRI